MARQVSPQHLKNNRLLIPILLILIIPIIPIILIILIILKNTNNINYPLESQGQCVPILGYVVILLAKHFMILLASGTLYLGV